MPTDSSTTTETQPQTLDDIVTAAVSKAPSELEGKLEPTEEREPQLKVESKEKEEPEEKEEEVEDLDEFGLTKKEQLEGRQLVAGLKDPVKAKIILDFFAKQGGYVEPPTTKTEAKEQVKDLQAELEEALGPELKYLADKMGPVIKKFVDNRLEEGTASLKKDMESQQLEKAQAASDSAIESISDLYFEGKGIPEKLMSQMTKVIDEIPMVKGQTPLKHLERVLFASAADLGLQVSKKGTTTSDKAKIEKHRTNAPAHLESGQRTSPKVGETTIHPQRQMSLTESIQAAIETTKSELSTK